MKKPAALLAAALLLLPLAATSAFADTVTEPKTGVAFDTHRGDMTLAGLGLRTKTFLKVKVYAIGLYVADSAVPGLKAKASSPDLYKDLVWGDFPKELQLKLVRDLSASQMQEAIHEALQAQNADKARTEAFIAYFGDIKVGQEYVLRWTPGGTLETVAVGQPKPPIADKNFAAAVFSIWLGATPIQGDIKAGLVSRLK